MAIKLFENISTVQNVPAATADTPRDRYKPISLYLVGVGTGTWSATISYSPVNANVYKKLGPVFTLTVSNSNAYQLFSWDYDCDSFVAWVSDIKGNASATLWMTQGNAQNLDYLLMTEPTARLKADPTDIPNCSLVYTSEGWTGNMGIFNTYSALLANPTNALVPGKVWAVVASASSFAKYNYMSAGWALESSVGPTGSSNIPGSLTNPFTNTTERDAWAAANPVELLSGGRTSKWTVIGGVPVEQVWVGAWIPVLPAGRIKTSTKMMSQIYENITAQSQTATNFCYHMTIVIPTDARRFRIPLDNASTTLPFRIKRAAIAVSNAVGADAVIGTTTNQVRFTPSTGAWVPITWDGGATSVEIPVAVDADTKTRKWSDTIALKTVKNTDGSALRVVMLRFWVEGTTSSPGNGYCTGSYTVAWRSLASNSSIHFGYIWQCLRTTIDGVTNPGLFEPTTELSGTPFVTAIEYDAYNSGLTIVVGGDSVAAGAVNSFSGNFGNGWAWNVLNNIRSRYPAPVDMVNIGFASKTSAVYSARFLSYLQDPDRQKGLLIYQPGSQNDGTPSESVINSQRAALATVQAEADLQETILSVITPVPNTSLGWSASADAYRMGFRGKLLALRSSRAVIDAETVSNEATPARYETTMTTDNAHPNEFGHYCIGSGGFTQISEFYGIK